MSVTTVFLHVIPKVSRAIAKMDIYKMSKNRVQNKQFQLFCRIHTTRCMLWWKCTCRNIVTQTIQGMGEAH